MRAQLPHGRAQVALDRFRAQAQPLRRARVRGARGDPGQHVHLARRQLHGRPPPLRDDARGRRQPAARGEQFAPQFGVGDPVGQGAQVAVSLAHLLPHRGIGRGLPGHRQQPSRLVAHGERLFQLARRPDRGRQRAVAELEGLAQRPVQDAAHPAPYDHGHRQYRAQPLRRDRRVVLVADHARGVVVRHRQGPAQRGGLAAEAGAGPDGEAAQRPRLRAGQLRDPELPGAGEQPAEGDRQSAVPAQPQQRRTYLCRPVRMRHGQLPEFANCGHPRPGVVRLRSLVARC